MKFIYIANIKLPTVKAHGIQIVKMCEAFAATGLDLELVIPDLPAIREDIFDYYGVKRIFKIKKIFSINLFRIKFFKKIIFLLQYGSFALGVFFYALLNLKKFKQADAVYFRDELAPWLIKPINKNIFIELHNFKNRYRFFRKFFKKGGLILITDQSKKEFAGIKIPEEKIFVAPDGVDIEKFDINISKAEARERIDLPKDKKIVLYAGHLYGWKGAEILAQATIISAGKFFTVFVGGTDEDARNFQDKHRENKNILILGQKPHNTIPYYLKAADVLVLPNKKGTALSEKYTSPLKLFEYMASKRPIVASDLLSIREILNSNNSVLAEPGNPEDLAKKILIILNDDNLAEKISQQAFVDVQNYTWEKRADNIINFIKNRNA